MAAYVWTDHWEERDSDGIRIEWVCETPDGLAVRYRNQPKEIYSFAEDGRMTDAGRITRLIPRPKPPTYRAWETIEEFVEDGGPDMWFKLRPHDGRDERIVRLATVDICSHPLFGFDMMGPTNCWQSFYFSQLFASGQCAKSLIGPWQPCGRKE
jgi:hypothetical protein